MTRFIWDKFSKDFLETLLSPYGTVVVSKEVTSEIKEIDAVKSSTEKQREINREYQRRRYLGYGFSPLQLVSAFYPCLRLNYNPIGHKEFIFSQRVSVQLLSSFISYPQSQRHYG